MNGFKVVASTMGRSTPATVSVDADSGESGYYRWHKMPGWVPNDPRCRRPEAPSGPAALKADKAARLAEFAGHLERGLTAQQAGTLMGLAAKTARTYERELQERQRREAAEPGPQEITRRLHEQIASQSPEHAVLVAEFERADALRVRPSGGREAHNARLMAERDARLRQYAALRASGIGKMQARRQMGLSDSVGVRYEADMHLVTGGSGD